MKGNALLFNISYAFVLNEIVHLPFALYTFEHFFSLDSWTTFYWIHIQDPHSQTWFISVIVAYIESSTVKVTYMLGGKMEAELIWTLILQVMRLKLAFHCRMNESSWYSDFLCESHIKWYNGLFLLCKNACVVCCFQLNFVQEIRLRLCLYHIGSEFPFEYLFFRLRIIVKFYFNVCKNLYVSRSESLHSILSYLYNIRRSQFNRFRLYYVMNKDLT